MRSGWNINHLSIACPFRDRLRAASPVVDCQCHGNLGFSGFQFLIGIVVTHANIFSSGRSSNPHGFAFSAGRNALLPRMDFTEEVTFDLIAVTQKISRTRRGRGGTLGFEPRTSRTP